jgi:hypothetical protein
VQITAENKDIPHFTPQHLEVDIEEETAGILVNLGTIIVEDRDAVSKETFMCNVTKWISLI